MPGDGAGGVAPLVRTPIEPEYLRLGNGDVESVRPVIVMVMFEFAGRLSSERGLKSSSTSSMPSPSRSPASMKFAAGLGKATPLIAIVFGSRSANGAKPGVFEPLLRMKNGSRSGVLGLMMAADGKVSTA